MKITVTGSTRKIIKAGKRSTRVDVSFTRQGRTLSRLGNPVRAR